MRGLMCLHRSLGRHDTVPVERNLKPRLAIREGDMNCHTRTAVERRTPMYVDAHGRKMYVMMADTGRICGDQGHFFVQGTSVRHAYADSDSKRRTIAKTAVVEDLVNIRRTIALQVILKRDFTHFHWRRRVHPTHMFLNGECMANGESDGMKARRDAIGDLVSASYLEVEETSPSAMMPIKVMMTNMAAIEGQGMSTYDVEGTLFLTYANQKGEPVYVRLGKMLANIVRKVNSLASRFKEVESHLYTHLLKRTCGLTQASCQFNLNLGKKLKDIGFLPLHGNLSACTRGKGSTRVCMCVHVDVILACGKATTAHFELELYCAVGISTREGKKVSCIDMLIVRQTNRYVEIMKRYGNVFRSRPFLDVDKVSESGK